MAKTFEFTDISPCPTREQTIKAYVEAFDERDIHHASHIADSIKNCARPLASHLVIIPVVAHQEAAQIPRALEQYALQTTDQPFSVILGLNSPTTEQDNPAIAATITNIAQARRRYPHLDIRTAMTFYDNPVIGTIRRDLWNGALLACIAEGAYSNPTDEVIGMNHDIDLASMSPRYIERVQRYYLQRQTAHTQAGIQSAPLPIRSTALTHAPSPDHPTISKGIYWMDFATRQAEASYEASIIIPMSSYAYKGGFKTDAKTYETHAIIQEDRGSRRIIPGTIMQTSPRRYIDRLQYGYENVWTEETFGANDACRTDHVKADMSLMELEHIIGRTLNDTIEIMTTSAINSSFLHYDSILREPQEQEIEDYLLMQKITGIISKKITLARHVLERVVQSDSLAKQAHSLHLNVDYYESIIDKHFLSDD